MRDGWLAVAAELLTLPMKSIPNPEVADIVSPVVQGERRTETNESPSPSSRGGLDDALTEKAFGGQEGERTVLLGFKPFNSLKYPWKRSNERGERGANSRGPKRFSQNKGEFLGERAGAEGFEPFEREREEEEKEEKWRKVERGEKSAD